MDGWMFSPCVIFVFSFQKMNRRLHLSKTKHSKFNESGQLAAFYLFSFIWGCSILTAVRGSGVTDTVPDCISCYLMRVSLSLTGGLCNKSHFLMGGLPSHSHGVSKDFWDFIHIMSLYFTILISQLKLVTDFLTGLTYSCHCILSRSYRTVHHAQHDLLYITMILPLSTLK